MASPTRRSYSKFNGLLIVHTFYGVRLVVSFIYGIFGFKESNIKSKIIPFLMVLAALVCLCV